MHPITGTRFWCIYARPHSSLSQYFLFKHTASSSVAETTRGALFRTKPFWTAGLSKMGPRIQEPGAQNSQRQSERSHSGTNEGLYNRLQLLSTILENFQDCNCPPDCQRNLGPEIARTPPRSGSPSGNPTTPRRPTRCRQVSKRSDARNKGRVLEEAQGTMEVQLPRQDGNPTGILRMSLQVFTDPDSGPRLGVSNACNILATSLLDSGLSQIPSPPPQRLGHSACW